MSPGRGNSCALKPHNGLGRPLGLELWTLRRDVTPLSTLIAYHSQYGARAPTNESMRFASAAMHARVEHILKYRDERDQSCALDLGDVAHLFGAVAGCVVRPITIIAPAHRPAFRGLSLARVRMRGGTSWAACIHAQSDGHHIESSHPRGHRPLVSPPSSVRGRALSTEPSGRARGRRKAGRKGMWRGRVRQSLSRTFPSFGPARTNPAGVCYPRT